MKGRGGGNFEIIPARESGFFAPDDVRSLSLINLADKERLVLVGNNNQKLRVFKVKR